MKQFLQTIKDSIYSPMYYRRLLTEPRGESFKFYFKVAAILSLLVAILFIPALLLLVQPGTYKAITDRYPSDLVITIQNGTIATNQQEPYYINSPIPIRSDITHLITFDTKTPFTSSQIEDYKTVILVKGDGIAVRQDANSTEARIVPVKDFGNHIITQQTILDLAEKIRHIAKYLVPFLFLGTIAVMMIGYCFQLLYAFFLALIVWLIAKSQKKQIAYGKAYQLSLHLMILPMLLRVFLMIFGIGLPPLAFTVIAVVFAVANLKNVTPSTPVEQVL